MVEKFKFTLEETAMATFNRDVVVSAMDKAEAREILAAYLFNRDSNKLNEGGDFLKIGEIDKSSIEFQEIQGAYFLENDSRGKLIGFIGAEYDSRYRPLDYSVDGTFSVAWDAIDKDLD